MKSGAGDLARPDLPKPTCRVMLVCGPPAAGKSTYVKAHASPVDLVIDLDLIARERGYGRDRSAADVALLLEERNRRLRALAKQPPERVAWVIVGAPSPSLRQWWSDALAVRPGDLVVLIPSREELSRRIRNDPDRRHVRELHNALVDKWMTRERNNNPGVVKSGCGVDGFPTDLLHPWRRGL